MKKSHARANHARQGLHRMIAETDRRHREAIDTHRKILVAAEARETALQQEIDGIKGKVLTDPAASEQYLKLIQERGRLQRTIQSARRTLS